MRYVNLKAASLAGLFAGVAYAATAEIDNRISRQNLDDLKLLGRLVVRNPTHAKLAGIPIHLINSISLATLYSLVRRFIPGNGAMQGMFFATVENTLLYPVASLEGRHPGIRRGEIDRYFTLKAYLLSIPRHLVFGATLGLLYDRFDRT